MYERPRIREQLAPDGEPLPLAARDAAPADMSWTVSGRDPDRVPPPPEMPRRLPSPTMVSAARPRSSLAAAGERCMRRLA